MKEIGVTGPTPAIFAETERPGVAVAESVAVMALPPAWHSAGSKSSA